MRFLRIAIASAVAASMAITLVACGGGTTTTTTTTATAAPGGKMKTAKMATGKIITMGAQNGSKQTGNATIATKGTGITVVVTLNNEPKGASEPAHIHLGTCAKLNPAPWRALSNVVGGNSTTTVPGVTVAQLGKGKYAINVHKSAKDLKTYVSCGDIK